MFDNIYMMAVLTKTIDLPMTSSPVGGRPCLCINITHQIHLAKLSFMGELMIAFLK